MITSILLYGKVFLKTFFVALPVYAFLVAIIGSAATGELFMPWWVQILIGIAAATVAGGVVWKKLIQPAARLITLGDAVLPLLEEMSEQLKDTPKAFEILNEIVQEFRPDSGTSLKDIIQGLKKSAEEGKKAADILAANAETARKLAEQDRRLMAELTESVNILRAKQRENIQSVDRMEAGDKIVASDLAKSRHRADEIKGEAGAAADAAAKPEGK